MARGKCACCGGEYNINADDTIRYHLTDRPECQESPGSRKCHGVGQKPAGAKPDIAGQLSFLCRVPSGPSGCGHQVQLTANHRARTHLTPHGTPCAEGSSAPPIAVGPEGYRADTADWTEAQWAEVLGTPEPPADLPHDRGVTTVPLPQIDPVECACNLQWVNAEAMRRAGHDDMDCEPAPMVAGPVEPEDVFDAVHKLTDETGVEWIHPGQVGDCRLPDCCTHPQGFVYGDDGKGHSGEECPLCGAEPPEPCRHDYVAYDDWDEQNGTECVTWACKHCGEPEPEAVTRMRTPARARCTVGELAEGLFFIRHITRGDGLVYRVQEIGPDWVEAMVVSTGAHAGRTGKLTNLIEEITCTDINGHPFSRRASNLKPRPQPPSSPEASAPASSRSKTAPARGSRPSTKATAPAATSTTSSPETASGPTAPVGTSTKTAPMTTDAQAAGDFLTAGSGSYGEAEAKYGRWGRYKLRHPATGQTVEWTRATTFAKSISDTYTLSQWAQRNVLVGATLRPDIVALAHGKDVARDREQLNGWTEELQQAAGSKVAANLGTAVHSFTERIDRNWDDRWKVFQEEIPDEFKPHVRAYIELLEEYGLVPVPHMIEFSTGVLQYEVMGTSDNCYRATKHLVFRMPRGEVRLSPGEHVIGDKKTGKDLDYGWQEICIQLALYAQGVNTQGIFNWADETWDPDPLSRFAEPGTKVREDVGVILHLPVDPRSTKHPALHAVDLESGWNATVLCERVRTWRKLRTLAGPVAVVDADPLAEDRSVLTPPARAVRPPTFRERAEAVTSKPEASQVYQDAVAAKLPVPEVKELISIMSEAIAKVAEPGGAKV